LSRTSPTTWAWSENSAPAHLFKVIEQGYVDAVLVLKQDRLFRSQSRELRGRIQDFLENRDIRLFSVKDELSQGRFLKTGA
jgi:DNA invertase Pin-like site-specific DNA recombinase